MHERRGGAPAFGLSCRPGEIGRAECDPF